MDKDITVLDKNQKLVTTDSGQFSMYLDTAKFEHLWRVSQAFSKSDMVPALFKGHPENVMIALEMAMRLAISPMMLMQNTYPIQGKIGMEAKLAIALINSSGLFDGPLSYEVKGSAQTDDLSCRAFAMRKGERVDGPWVTWAIVKSEGWLAKSGSKWKTMPELMIQYRAATFFGRMICPERLMGMQTVEEIEDVGPTKEVKAETLAERFNVIPQLAPEEESVVTPEEKEPEPTMPDQAEIFKD